MKFSKNTLTLMLSASLSLILGGLTAQPWNDGGFPGSYQQDGGMPGGYSDWNSGCCQRPVTCGCGEFFFRADYLYWQYCADELDFVTISETTSTSSTDFSTVDSDKHVGEHCDSGFRLGVGYKNANCCWDVALNWTYFHPDRNHRHVTVPDDSFVFFGIPDVSFDNGDEFFTDFTGSHRLKLDYVDLELGRELCWGSCIAFRPFIGLRWENLHQNFDVRYLGDFDFSTLTTFEGRSNERNRFWGIGPRVGLDANWTVGCGWGFYGGSAISLLYGQHKHRGSFNYFDTLGRTSFEGFRSSHKCAKFVADAEVGLYYKYSFCDNQYPFLARIGWETHLFLDQAKWFGTVDVENTDLTTQGLTVSAIIGF